MPGRQCPETMPGRLPRRTIKRNVIGAPIPPGVLAPIYDRLHQRIDRIESSIVALRVLACATLVLFLATGGNATSAASGFVVTTLVVYMIFALLAWRRQSWTFARYLPYSDVALVPALLLADFHQPASMRVIVFAAGCWIVLNALRGDVWFARKLVACYAGMAILAIIFAGAGPIVIGVAAAIAMISISVSEIQQRRLTGRTIGTIEMLQRTLAMRDNPNGTSDDPPFSESPRHPDPVGTRKGSPAD